MSLTNPNYAVTITALTDGDNLGCSKTVNVAWEKPAASDQARINLYCSCSQHSGSVVSYFDTPTNASNTGDCNLPLTHADGTNQTSCGILVVITHNNTEQNRDQRVEMTAQCPPQPDSAFAAKATAAGSGKPIELDAPDADTVQLRRGQDKTLSGKIDRTFGRRVLVMVQKVKSGRQVLLLAKEVGPWWWFSDWEITLPQALWQGTDVLNVRIAFVKPNGVLGYAETWPTRVT